jgi:hypothetical protein
MLAAAGNHGFPHPLDRPISARRHRPILLVRRPARVELPAGVGQVGADAHDRIATHPQREIECRRHDRSPGTQHAAIDAHAAQPRSRRVLGDTEDEHAIAERGE